MKILKISFIVFTLLVVLLVTGSPASAKVTRIDFYQIGGDECLPVLDPPHISGPNIHLYGTYTCTTDAYTMDGEPFPMFTGVITWFDAQAQVVDGQIIRTAKLRVDTVEGGSWVGSFAWPANGTLKSVLHGEGVYDGMLQFGYYDPVEGLSGGTILITK